MNSFVIDVNILFSGLISRKKFYEELFLRYKFYAPDFALIELQKYKNLIRKKLVKHKEDFEKFAVILFSNLNVIPDFLIDEEIIQKAEEYCNEVDFKDSPYLALSIFMNKPLITRDKPLYNHLKNNIGFEKIILFEDFINEFLKD